MAFGPQAHRNPIDAPKPTVTPSGGLTSASVRGYLRSSVTVAVPTSSPPAPKGGRAPLLTGSTTDRQMILIFRYTGIAGGTVPSPADHFEHGSSRPRCQAGAPAGACQVCASDPGGGSGSPWHRVRPSFVHGWAGPTSGRGTHGRGCQRRTGAVQVLPVGGPQGDVQVGGCVAGRGDVGVVCVGCVDHVPVVGAVDDLDVYGAPDGAGRRPHHRIAEVRRVVMKRAAKSHGRWRTRPAGCRRERVVREPDWRQGVSG